MIQMGYNKWYVELYNSDGRAAKWWAMLPDFATVHEVMWDVRQRGAREIVRIMPPLDAARADLDALKNFGAKRI